MPISDAAHDDRALVAFTALLGGLIGADLLLSFLGWGGVGFPLGLSLTMIAALLGAVYIVYGTIRSLLQRRIGADLALAQASLAALVIGQPFVAAEVVFIALLGEVLEAWTFCAHPVRHGSPGRTDPAHGTSAAGRAGDRDPRRSGRDRRSSDRRARRADSRLTVGSCRAVRPSTNPRSRVSRCRSTRARKTRSSRGPSTSSAPSRLTPRRWVAIRRSARLSDWSRRRRGAKRSWRRPPTG